MSKSSRTAPGENEIAKNSKEEEASVSFTLAITAGQERDRPQGKLVTLNTNRGAVDALAIYLQETHKGKDPWLVPGSFRNNYRNHKNFISTLFRQNDIDYHNAEGKHVEAPADKVESLLKLAKSGALGGHVFHLTKRFGGRLSDVYDSPITSKGQFEELALARITEINRALADHGLDAKSVGKGLFSGYFVDVGATRDVAHFFWVPNGEIEGVVRKSEIIVISETPYELAKVLAKDNAIPKTRGGAAFLPPYPAPQTKRVDLATDVSWPETTRKKRCSEAVLSNAVDRIQNAGSGERHNTLRNQTILVAGYAAHLDEECAKEALLVAARQCQSATAGDATFSDSEITTTLASAWAYGLEKPLEVPPAKDRISPAASETNAGTAGQRQPEQSTEELHLKEALAAADNLVVSAGANPNGIINKTVQDKSLLRHVAYLQKNNVTAYETLQFGLKGAGVRKEDLATLKRCARDGAKELKPEPEYTPLTLAEILPDLKVLGEQDGVILLFDRTKKRYHSLQRPKDLDYALLVLIAGEAVIENVSPKQTKKDPRTPLSTVMNLIALEARRRQLRTTTTIGQGMWNVGDGRILVVSGKDAATWDGSEAEYLDTPLVGSTLVELDGSRPWAGALPSLIEKASSMTTTAATAVCDEIVDIVGRWKFQSELVVTVIAMMILSMPIQTIWKWRPHVWITGGADTGKSTFLKFIEDLFGSLSLLREARITEAGLRQEVRQDSRVILLDEFEKNDHREAIMELLRASSSGIELTRGTRGHKPVTFGLRHSAWVGSIEVNLSRAADRGRFLVAALEKFLSRSTPVTMSSDEYKQLRERTHAVALWASLPALRYAEQIKATKIDGVAGRLVECLSVPVSLLAVCSGWSEDRACEEMKVIAKAFADSSPLPTFIADELELVQDICLSRIRVAEAAPGKYSDGTRYVEHTVAQVLAEGDDGSLKQLAQHGIKAVATEHGDEIFVYPDGVGRDLLKSTRWSGLDLRTILLRLPKARCDRCRIAGSRPNGVYIPRKFFEGGEDDLEGGEDEPDF